MPTIIRAEYLGYFNPSRNSDKLFYVFLVRADDGTYSCLTENGKRGSNLVRRTVCENVRRETAMQSFWEKVREKRNHRETPYTDETFGKNYSRIAAQFTSGAEAEESRRRFSQTNDNLTVFLVEKKENSAEKPKPCGIFNREQLESLEL